MSDLMLDVDQAGELKAAFRRGNWTNAQIKLFCQGDTTTKVREVLEGIATIVPCPLLHYLGSITCAPTAFPFLASEHFVLGTGSNAAVKVSYLSDNFTAWFLTKTEDPKSESTLCYHRLCRASVDAPIIAELGGEENAEMSLSTLYALMECQKDGGDGPLLINGYVNLFYIKDVSRMLRAVVVRWHGDGWYVSACSVEIPNTWYDGFQVFSRQP